MRPVEGSTHGLTLAPWRDYVDHRTRATGQVMRSIQCRGSHRANVNGAISLRSPTALAIPPYPA